MNFLLGSYLICWLLNYNCPYGMTYIFCPCYSGGSCSVEYPLCTGVISWHSSEGEPWYRIWLHAGQIRTNMQHFCFLNCWIHPWTVMQLKVDLNSGSQEVLQSITIHGKNTEVPRGLETVCIYFCFPQFKPRYSRRNVLLVHGSCCWTRIFWGTRAY